MTIWSNTAVLGLYTLSPTHYGTGQTTGAVDLPIARDAATGFPVLPASGIKGVLREAADHTGALAGKVKALFGAWIGDTESGDLTPGRLAFTEGRLIAYPARSLSQPFLHVTCPLILEGLKRDLRATGGSLGSPLDTIKVSSPDSGARVADPALDGQAVVLEDLIYPAEEVTHDKAVEALAHLLAALIPDQETATRARLTRGLVVIPDADFAALMQSAIPVHARVQLTSVKTTDSPNGESGNLWYEEALPSDCLFAALIGERRSHGGQRANGHTGNDPAGLDDLIACGEALQVLQIGGNETVGQGLCLATLVSGQNGRVTL